MDLIKVCLMLISMKVVGAYPGHNNRFIHRIHVPQKIKTIYHTKIIKVPEHHHYFHEKEKIIPEHHHYIHEKEKLIKYEDHKPDDEFDYYNNKNDYQTENDFQPSEYQPNNEFQPHEYRKQYQQEYQPQESKSYNSRKEPKQSHGYEIEEAPDDEDDPYYPPHPFTRDNSDHRDHYPSASELKTKRVPHRKRPPSRSVPQKHYKRKFH